MPLSNAAMAILRDLPRLSDYVFPGQKEGKPLSNMAMLTLLKRMDKKGFTVHGFRSSFRDWAAEQTNYPREIAEKALAHSLDSKTEEAYQRGDLLKKRRKMMTAWAKYCDKPAPAEGNVTRLRA